MSCLLLAAVLCLSLGANAMPMMPPTFLQGLNQTAIQAYYQIKQNQNETIRQQKLDESNWANKYGVQQQWNAYQTNMTQMQEQLQANITRVINQLATANQQLQQIQQNQDQTPAAMRQAIEKFKNDSGVAAKILLEMPRYFMGKGDHKDDNRHNQMMMGPGPVRMPGGSSPMPNMMNQQMMMNQPMMGQQYNPQQQGQFNSQFQQPPPNYNQGR